MGYTVKDIAEFVKGELKGDGAVEIKGVSGIDDAKAGDITFIDNPKFKDKIKNTWRWQRGKYGI